MRLIRPLAGFKAERTNSKLSAQWDKVSTRVRAGKWEPVYLSKKGIWVNVFREPTLALSPIHHQLCKQWQKEPESNGCGRKGFQLHRGAPPRTQRRHHTNLSQSLDPIAHYHSFISGGTLASPEVSLLGSEHIGKHIRDRPNRELLFLCSEISHMHLFDLEELGDFPHLNISQKLNMDFLSEAQLLFLQLTHTWNQDVMSCANQEYCSEWQRVSWC